MKRTNNIINGRYIRHEPLGEGGMGIVYRATDRLKGEIVALKQVHLTPQPTTLATHPRGQVSNHLRLALAREFQILASLRHPHIISVLDYGFDENQHSFFTMTYLPHAHNIIEASRNQTTAVQLNFIHQILQALIYLHRRGVLHRDLKPDNVLVTNNHLHLLDFGLSAMKPDNPASSGGTPYYAAPEIWQHQPYTEAADLFAVGLITYELLTGRHPFAPLDGNYIDRLLQTSPDTTQLPPILAPIISRLLAKKPTDRYPTAQAAYNALTNNDKHPATIENPAIQESYLQATTFVGRTREMEQLTNALTLAQQGQGAFWLIGGESGVGKSRLLDEIRIHALVSGWQVIRGQASTNGNNYHLWQNVVAQLILNTPLTSLQTAVLKTIVPHISQLLDYDVPDAPQLEGEAGRQRLITTLIDLLQHHPRPLLLLLEDLQWAVEGLAPLQILARLPYNTPLFIIGTFRDDESPQLPQELAGAHLLTLPRLHKEAITQLSIAMLGQTIGSRPDIVTLLQQETEGNCFFLTEVVRALAEQAGRLTQIGQMTLPTHIFTQPMQNLVQRRLQRAPATYYPLLQSAAIAGRELDTQLLSHLKGSINLTDWLAIYQETAVLTLQEERWRFAHDKIRESVLQQLTPSQQSHLSQQVAQAIEHLYPNDLAQAAKLATLWQTAGNSERECHYALHAAQYANQHFAYNEAIHFLNRAWHLLPTDAYAQRYQLLLIRESISHLRGHRDTQRDDLEAMQTLATNGHLHDIEQIEIWLRWGRYYNVTADFPALVETAQKALNLAQQHQHIAYQATSYRFWGMAIWNMGELATGRAHLQTALALTQPTELHYETADILRELGARYAFEGNFTQSIDCSQQALAISQQIGYRDNEAEILSHIAIVHSMQGIFAEAQNYYAQVLQISRLTGDRRRELLGLGNLGLDLIKQGSYEQAKNNLTQALAISQAIQDRQNEMVALNNLGLLHHALQENETAYTYTQQALDLSQALGEQRGQNYILTLLGHIHFAMGRLPEATNAYQQAIAQKQELGQNHTIPEPMAGLARITFLQKSYPRTKEYLETILTTFKAHPTLPDIDLPFRVYCITIHLLKALADPRAQELLHTAYHHLQQQAAKIHDTTLRTSFLENVAEHQEIIQWYQSQSATVNNP